MTNPVRDASAMTLAAVIALLEGRAKAAEGAYTEADRRWLDTRGDVSTEVAARIAQRAASARWTEALEALAAVRRLGNA